MKHDNRQSRLTLVVYLFLTVFTASSHAAVNNNNNKNALYQHASPYLAMHGQDPVNWLDWKATALDKAKQSNKIIMISSGYFSCHWCHVMQTENYHDQETANFLNQHFISVKIDRELTPDLDRYLIDFAQRAAGHAGWPQHVFLTPNGYPFFAFTYKPKPDFLASLKKIQSVWSNSRDRVIATAKSAILPIDKPINRSLKKQAFIQAFIAQLLPQMDRLSGGLIGSNKFPNASILKTALLLKHENNEISDWLMTSLDQMQSQHLFDHVHGGFYRYTVDPEWQIPHFEKMLYTQAMLAEIYLIAGEKYSRQDYTQTAKQTLNYVIKQLYHPASGLYLSSQSAVDKNQVEAANYVWTEQQLKQTLNNKLFEMVKESWLTQSTEYEIPYQSQHEPAWHPLPTEKYWQKIKQALAESKLKPSTDIPTDSKSILGWNGLLLTAFSKAVELKQLDKRIAEDLAQNLIKNLDQVKPPRALSAINQNMGEANIQDYAYIIQGLESWAKISKKNKRNDHKPKVQYYRQQAKAKFKTSAGWRYANSPILPGQQGSHAMRDNAIPSPTAILDCALNQLLMSNPMSFASYGTCY